MIYEILTIPHLEQDYNTIGNWKFTADYKKCMIIVSDMGDERLNDAIALHELSEVMTLLNKYTPQIAQRKVDEFDERFEKRRIDDFESEPGDDPKSPYHLEHGFASGNERHFMAFIGKNWKEYEDKMIELCKQYDKYHGKK